MEKKKPEVKRKELTYNNSVEVFAQAICDGHSAISAYRLSHPSCKSDNDSAIAVRASGFAKDERVHSRIDDIRAEMAEKHKAFRDTLIEYLQTEISECWIQNRTISPVMKQVDTLTRVLGMDKQVIDIKAKLGPIDNESAKEKINFLAEKARGE